MRCCGPASSLTGPPAWQLKPHLAKAFACERRLDVPAGTWAGSSRLMVCTAGPSGVRRPPWQVLPSRRPIVQRPSADCEDDPEPGTRTSTSTTLNPAHVRPERRALHNEPRLDRASLSGETQMVDFARVSRRS